MALDPNVLIGGLVTVCTAWLKVSQARANAKQVQRDTRLEARLFGNPEGETAAEREGVLPTMSRRIDALYGNCVENCPLKASSPPLHPFPNGAQRAEH
jgi:hypothetical protein